MCQSEKPNCRKLKYLAIKTSHDLLRHRSVGSARNLLPGWPLGATARPRCTTQPALEAPFPQAPQAPWTERTTHRLPMRVPLAYSILHPCLRLPRSRKPQWTNTRVHPSQDLALRLRGPCMLLCCYAAMLLLGDDRSEGHPALTVEPDRLHALDGVVVRGAGIDGQPREGQR